MASDEDFKAFRAQVEAARGPRSGQTEEGLTSELRTTWAPIFAAIERMNREVREVSDQFSVKLGYSQTSLMANKMITQAVASKGGGVQHAFDIVLRPHEAQIEDKSDKNLTGGSALTFKADGDIGAGSQAAAKELLSLIGKWFQSTMR